MGGRVATNTIDHEWIAGLERVDRHVLGAVVLEDATDVGRQRDEQQVADEQGDPDQPFEERLDDPVAAGGGRGLGARGERRKNQREQEEDADRNGKRDPEQQRDRSPAELDALFAGGDAGAPDEPSGPDHERLVEDDEATHEGQLRHARSVEAAVEPLRCGDDAAVGMTQGHGDGVATSHQDALDERLAAVGISGHEPKSTGSNRADRQDDRSGRSCRRTIGQDDRGELRAARGGPPHHRGDPRSRPDTGPSYARAERSSRFWNRSTWPAVSMIVCLPV